jgi:hypothetical protein
MFVLFALTDWLDGYLARKLNQTSAFGAFLDPVADKFLVCASLLVLLDLHRVDALVALIIIGREIAISALREWMAQIGASRSVAVHMLGKLKTVVADGGHSLPAVRRPAVRRDRHAPLGHLADGRRGRADGLVDGVLPAQGDPRDPGQGQMTARRVRPARRPCCGPCRPVFVLIWSTGFVVARYGMPHAPPLKLPGLALCLSVLAFPVDRPGSRARLAARWRQWLHLAVTGVLMHAGYLGGVWAAVKGGPGRGLAALIVGLQPC